ncbi:hypothetical protein SAMN05444714_2480 [Yoonia litorea]|uniref:Uncharacterized protein n=2 Tax=Yoonia litorea TaxID=1123755 RepID=A0A1I6MWR2_9RHOB|nr:hypothetical protein SAMN05444714_2480 [Yoonia litorea]
MHPHELKSKYGKPMRQLESAMIVALSGYGDGKWFSLSQLMKEMRLPLDFALGNDVEGLVAQRLAAWNWYRHNAQRGDRFVRRNHKTETKLIILADRRNIKTDASWPPHEVKDTTSVPESTGLLSRIRKRKRSLQLQRTT